MIEKTIEDCLWSNAQLLGEKVAVKSGRSSVTYAELRAQIMAAATTTNDNMKESIEGLIPRITVAKTNNTIPINGVSRILKVSGNTDPFFLGV